ncbi:hypothetical protein F5Y12DRAFT_591333 [Xylaria sp. FL1777]|nr:hypothetical protein F5Y12DRAFT_591333 [Xylaria sp. FL1777]
MESPTTTALMNNIVFSLGQRKPVLLRAPYCNADNCYRALFPCPSPSAVTEAVRYCATVSDDSATNYPTKAIAACGTSRDLYISACSCPATNCLVGSVSETTTSQRTALLVVTTTIVEEGSSQYDLVTIITQIQDPATAANTRASASTQTSNDGAGGSDRNPTTVRSANEIITTELTVTKHISSYYVSFFKSDLEKKLISRLEGSVDSVDSVGSRPGN